jgi:ribosomal protein L7/L12
MDIGEIFDILEKEFGNLREDAGTINFEDLTCKLTKKELPWLNSLRETINIEIGRLKKIRDELSYIDLLRGLPLLFGWIAFVLIFNLFSSEEMKSTLIGDFLRNAIKNFFGDNITLNDTIYEVVNSVLSPVIFGLIALYLIVIISRVINLNSKVDKLKKKVFLKKYPDYPSLCMFFKLVKWAIQKKETIILKGVEDKYYDVILLNLGKSPLDVLKIIRTENLLGSGETLKLLKRSPPIVGNHLSMEDAIKLGDRLKTNGAEVAILKANTMLKTRQLIFQYEPIVIRIKKAILFLKQIAWRKKNETISGYILRLLKERHSHKMGELFYNDEIKKERKDDLMLLLHAQMTIKLIKKRFSFIQTLTRKKVFQEYSEKNIAPYLEKIPNTSSDMIIPLAALDAIDAIELFELKRQRSELYKKYFDRKSFAWKLSVAAIIYVILEISLQIMGRIIFYILGLSFALQQNKRRKKADNACNLLDKRIEKIHETLENFLKVDIFNLEKYYNSEKEIAESLERAGIEYREKEPQIPSLELTPPKSEGTEPEAISKEEKDFDKEDVYTGYPITPMPDEAKPTNQENFPDLMRITEKMPHKKEVFISHSNDDKEVAMALCNKFEAHGIGCWIGVRDITPTEIYVDSIIDGITNCRVLLLILSETAVKSRHLVREVELAFSKGIRILPLLIEDITPSEAVKYFLGPYQWFKTNDQLLEEYFPELLFAVRKILTDDSGGKEALPAETVKVTDEPVQKGGEISQNVPPIDSVTEDESPPQEEKKEYQVYTSDSQKWESLSKNQYLKRRKAIETEKEDFEFIIDGGKNKFYYKGKLIEKKIPSLSIKFLKYLLLEKCGLVVYYEELYEIKTGKKPENLDAYDRNSLHRVISDLRTRLGVEELKPLIKKKLPGVGYEIADQEVLRFCIFERLL